MENEKVGLDLDLQSPNQEPSSVVFIELVDRILSAVEGGDGKEEIVKLLKEKPREVKSVVSHLCDKYHLLHRACLLGDEELVVLLTAFASDIDDRSPLGTPLSIACEQGYDSIVDVLLCNRATISEPVPLFLESFNESFHRSCPFFQAASNRWISILKLLIDSKSEIFRNLESCKNLLKISCVTGDVDVLQFCFDALIRISISKDELLSFVRNELFTICLALNKINLLSCLLSSKCGAFVTEAVSDRYCDVIGRYLDQFAKVIETDSTNSPDDRQRRSADGSWLVPVSIDWSNKNLHVLTIAWIAPYVNYLTDLDLSYNDLSILPEVVPWNLTNLRNFIITDSKLEYLLSPSVGTKVQCVRLVSIDLSYNLLSNLPLEIFHLPSLEKLNLSNNKIKILYSNNDVTNLAVEWGCISLKELNISNNFVESLPFQMHSCVQLVSLQASTNQLTNFVHPWTCPLKDLDLSYNSLSDMPLSLDNFWDKTLHSLKLSKNDFMEIPQTICRLAALNELDLSHNAIQSLPNPDWWRCDHLQMLDLSHNKLGSSSSSSASPSHSESQKSFVNRFNQKFLSKVKVSISSSGNRSPNNNSLMTTDFLPSIFSKSLTSLNLSHNQLKEIPMSVCQMNQLTRLDLSFNVDMTSIPTELIQLNQLHSLSLEGLQLSDRNLMRKIKNDDTSVRGILAYLKQMHCMCVPFHRVKLMLVGSQEKGKTSLAHSLRNVPCPSQNIATNGVEITEFKLSAPSRGISFNLKKMPTPDLTVQLWDFAGQRDYYVTHKVFLSSSALYLVIFDLRLNKQGVDGLGLWLSDIQAHAPNSHVIIVGTFLDCLSEARINLPDLRRYIVQTYNWKNGFPRLDGIIEVSNIGRKEGLEELKKLIYEAALKIRVKVDNYGQETLVGRLVPKDYLDLIGVLQKEVKKYKQEEKWPVLNEEEFFKLFDVLPNHKTKEEMELAAQFLNEAGYLLHFKGLGQLYFINPQWLAQTLAKFFAVDSVQRFARGGLIDMKDAQDALLFDARHSDVNFDDYVDLMEAFDIVLRLDNNRLLLPSKLPSVKPGIERTLKPRSPPIIAEERQLYRIYQMNHVPSGFWSRLLVQMLSAVQDQDGGGRGGGPGGMDGARRSNNSGGQQNRKSIKSRQRQMSGEAETTKRRHLGTLEQFSDRKITYWQEGIIIDCVDYHLLIESSDQYFQDDNYSFSASSSSSSSEMTTTTDNFKMTAGGGRGGSGIVITVTKMSSGDEDLSHLEFTLAAFAFDYIDSLIYQWYPGLLEEGCLEQLIPCPRCMAAKSNNSSSNNNGSSFVTFNGVHMFSLIECEQVILDAQTPSDLTLRCNRCQSSRIHLRFLVPDLLLLDLPQHLHISISQVEFNPAVDVLGKGGEGTVYKGSFLGQSVALKQNGIIESCRAFMNSMKDLRNAASSKRSRRSSESDEVTVALAADFFWKSKTLNAFAGFRQETCVLTGLSHPCIISILGICAPSLSYIMELSPHGSLRNVLVKNMEVATSGGNSREGKLLNKLLKYKIIYQIIYGLQYLHSEEIVYKDLKPDNVLIWSLNVDDVINVKLSDYGLARRLTKQGLMGIEGTTGYQAPEIRQQKPYNEKVDIFAFAMVVHELLTDEPCFSETSSVAVNKFISQGRRPINDTSRMIPTQMMCLIESCWSQNPNDRPSADDIIKIIADVSFIARERTIALDTNRILGNLNFTYFDEKLGLHHPYLRFWTGNDSGRCYHIFNAALGQFKIINQCHPGPRINSMIIIDKLMIIGTENPSLLQIMAFNRITNKLDKLSEPTQTNDVPLFFLRHDKKSNEFFVGFANSEFHHYSLDPSSSSSDDDEIVNMKCLGVVRLSDDVSRSAAAICGLSIADGNELWIGCGPDIVIVDVSNNRFEITIQIEIFSSMSSRQIVSRMCCHGDQVWCLNRRDAIVVELDVESRNIVCVFDCSRRNPLDDVVSNFDWMEVVGKRRDLNATKAAAMSSFPMTTKVVDQLKELKLALTPDSGKTFVNGGGGGLSYKRKRLSKRKTPERATRTTITMYAAEECVKSLCFVKGTLWIGRESGDILMINVTQNNPYGFEHGKVLSVLRESVIVGGKKNFRIDHLVNMSDDRVVATTTSTDGNNVRLFSTQLVIWSAFGLAEINQFRQIWESIKEEKRVSRKSPKSPSTFF